MAKILGIDLGTTNSVVAVVEGSEPQVIALADGSRLCPSVFGVSRSGERLVGQLAKRQAITNPDRTVSSIKRQMGTNYRVDIDDKSYTPQEISAQILSKLKADAEAFLGQQVSQAVITVPAYFSDTQRQATKDAGAIAGLDVVRIINEPTAAALAYGAQQEGIQTILVWDLGGGTFDVSILELGEGVFEVKATNGDTMLGGDDWDEAVMMWMAQEFKVSHGVDLTNDRIAMQRLKEAAEKAKMELSSVVTASINLPFISVTAEGPAHLDLLLTRAKFEEMTTGLLNRMKAPTNQAMADARMEPADIQKVLLVGGSTRMPAVQTLVTEMFKQEPHKGLNPDEVVGLGAAIQGGILGGEVKGIVLLDVTPLSLGIETQGGVFTRLIERNTTIPTSKSQIFTTAVDGQTTVDIHVLQGEREFAGDNKTLGRFQLTGIPNKPKGTPRVEVTFDIDVNGIAHVLAKDTATNNKQSLTITSTTSLSKDEVSRLVDEANSLRAEDHKRREVQEMRNRADSLISNAEKLIRENDGRVAAYIVEDVRSAISDARQAFLGADPIAVRAAIDTLTSRVYRLSTAALEAASAASPDKGDGWEEQSLNDDKPEATGVGDSGHGEEPV
ncbi:MAG: molecular chaperone DnaK [Armatimonadota bacterium]